MLHAVTHSHAPRLLVASRLRVAGYQLEGYAQREHIGEHERVSTSAKQITCAVAAGVIGILFCIGTAYFASKFVAAPKDVSPFMYFISEIVKATGVFIGIPAVILGLWTYSRSIRDQQLAQTWKRQEFVANSVKDFRNRRTVTLAMQMLDYTVRWI